MNGQNWFKLLNLLWLPQQLFLFFLHTYRDIGESAMDEQELELLFFPSPQYSVSTPIWAFLFPDDGISQLLQEGHSLSLRLNPF